jgi:NitT/TauT family transport system substrate-binding protein
VANRGWSTARMVLRRQSRRADRVCAILLAVVTALLATPLSLRAETVKVGIVKSTMVGDLRIAAERGYFAAEGLSVDVVDFESAQPVAVAAASGDIDFGSVGLTGGFYSLAAQGVLKIVSSSTRDVPGYHTGAYLVSNGAFGSGLTHFKAWAGKKIAITQVGSPYHYSLALLADKYGIDLKGLQLLPLQSVPNEVSAIIGNKADAALIPVPVALPVANRGDAHLLGFTGDEAPWQFSVLFASAKTATTRAEMVERFLRALHRGGRDYHEAFSGPQEERRDGPTAAAIETLLAKSSAQPIEQVKISISYIDPTGKLDMQDLARQIAWYHAQGMLKNSFSADDIIDSRFVSASPAP